MKAGILPTDAEFGVEDEEIYGPSPHSSFLASFLSIDSFFPGTFITPDGTATKTPSQKGHYGKFYSNLVSAINGEKQCVVKPQEAADVVRMVELIGESNRLGIILDVAQ